MVRHDAVVEMGRCQSRQQSPLGPEQMSPPTAIASLGLSGEHQYPHSQDLSVALQFLSTRKVTTTAA